jgi:hypothetical protein
MFEETLMHVQDRPTPAMPALAPTWYMTGPVTTVVTGFTSPDGLIPFHEFLQGEFEQEAE